MREKTVAVVVLNPESSASFDETLRQAAERVELAAARGAHLAVLPETINLLHHGTPEATLDELALEDWPRKTAMLCERAAGSRIALVLPLLVRENGVLANRFYVLSKIGESLGYYQKRVPSTGEQACGVEPGQVGSIAWEGLRIGGGICIDVYYPQTAFDSQISEGADFFVVPSLTPAGIYLDYCAVHYGVPFVLAYPQWSRILDRDGLALVEGGYRSETLRFGFGQPVFLSTINFNAVTLFADYNQSAMSEIAQRYGANVRIRFDQSNCLFTLESRTAGLEVSEIMQEYGLVSRRDYFVKHGPRAPQPAPGRKGDKKSS